jgi:predicted acyltransferase
MRYLSLDVFRGATVALMILVNNPGSWSHLYAPLAHARWHGCTLTDLVFPFFLFAVGNAMAFSMATHANEGSSAYLLKVGQRTLWIFGLGLLLNLSPFVRWSPQGELAWRSLEHLRIMGVLQRIALSYAGAALLICVVPRRALPVAAMALLLAYWVLCLGLGQAGDPYSLEGFFGTSWDRALLGAAHLYQGEGVAFDPEGLASSLPCVSQVVLGYLLGQRLRSTAPSAALVRRLLLWAVALLALGLLWSLLLPLNKKIWSSSYVLYSSGCAVATLAALVWLLELRQWRGAWLRFFVVFGSNALFIFCLSGFLPRVLALARWSDGLDAAGAVTYTSSLRWLYLHGLAPVLGDAPAGSLAFAMLMVGFYWLIAEQLYRRGILLKV